MVHSRESGYVITTTMVVIFSVVFVGLFFGFSLVKNAWFKKVAFEKSVEVYVRDQNDVVLGKAVDFDEHEAPLIPFVDYDVPAGSDDNYRVLVGIRDDRFTSREKIYYTSNNCTIGGGNVACMFDPSTETSGNATINSEDVDMITGTGGVSYQVATQGAINYAIGSSNGGLPGRLYRQSQTVCDTETAKDISSYWMSQSVVAEGGTDSGGGTNPPCYEVQFFVEIESTALRCQPSKAVSTNNCTGPGEVTPPQPFCRTALKAQPGNNPPEEACLENGDLNWGGDFYGACPQTSQGDWFVRPAGNNAGWCCPPDADPDVGGAGQCQQISNNLPTEGTFFEAESVGGATNILDPLVPPFLVNFPINPDDFVSSPPDGEG